MKSSLYAVLVRRVGNSPTRQSGWPLIWILTGVGFGLARYTDLVWGNETMNPDVQRAFLPIARAIASGRRLYGLGLADNKPPGWQVLNAGAYLTGEYTLVMLLVVGIANGAAASLLWRWIDDIGFAGVAVAASTLFLLTLPLAGGHHINSRSMMVAFLLLGAVGHGPIRQGVAVAAATLVNAYAALFIPVFLWGVWNESATPRADGIQYLLSGGIVGMFMFALVGVIWGLESMSAALHWSFGVPLVGEVATSPVHPTAGSPGSYVRATWLLTHPFRWVSYITTLGLQLLPVLTLACIGWVYGDQLSESSMPWSMLRAALVAGFAPFLVRAYEQYWLVPLPFLVVFAATGLGMLLRNDLPDRATHE